MWCAFGCGPGEHGCSGCLVAYGCGGCGGSLVGLVAYGCGGCGGGGYVVALGCCGYVDLVSCEA